MPLVATTAVSLAPLMKVRPLLVIVAPAGAVIVEVPAAVLLTLVAEVNTAPVAAASMFVSFSYGREQAKKTERKIGALVTVWASSMSRQAAAEVVGLVKTELMTVGWVPVFIVMSASAATAALRPTMVKFETLGWAKKAVPDGAADHSRPRLPLVTAVGFWVMMPNWAPPRQPVSVSRPSSSAPLMTMLRRLTVPPKISMPSSDEL